MTKFRVHEVTFMHHYADIPISVGMFTRVSLCPFEKKNVGLLPHF